MSNGHRARVRIIALSASMVMGAVLAGVAPSVAVAGSPSLAGCLTSGAAARSDPAARSGPAAATAAATSPALNGWNVADIIDPDGSYNRAAFAVTGPTAGVIVYRSSKTIYVRRTTDGGDSWSARVRISPAGATVRDFKAAMFGSHVDVLMFVGSKTLHRHSGTGGRTWDAIHSVGSFPLWKLSRGPGGILAAIGLTSNQVWRVTVSTDGGATWHPSTTVGKWGTCVDTEAGPDIVVAGGGVIVVAFTNDDINYVARRSTDHGSTWSAPRVLTDGNFYVASLGASGATVVAAFDDEAGIDRRLELKRSTDGGLTWSALIEFGTQVTGAEVGFSKGSWHLVSSDDTGTWRYRSSANGLTWSTPVIIDTGHGFLAPPVGVGAFTSGPAAAFLDAHIWFAHE